MITDFNRPRVAGTAIANLLLVEQVDVHRVRKSWIVRSELT